MYASLPTITVYILLFAGVVVLAARHIPKATAQCVGDQCPINPDTVVSPSTVDTDIHAPSSLIAPTSPTASAPAGAGDFFSKLQEILDMGMIRTSPGAKHPPAGSKQITDPCSEVGLEPCPTGVRVGPHEEASPDGNVPPARPHAGPGIKPPDIEGEGVRSGTGVRGKVPDPSTGGTDWEISKKGEVCGGRPGDPWWSENCMCHCGQKCPLDDEPCKTSKACNPQTGEVSRHDIVRLHDPEGKILSFEEIRQMINDETQFLAPGGKEKMVDIFKIYYQSFSSALGSGALTKPSQIKAGCFQHIELYF